MSQPLLIAIILASTALSLVVPVLKDAGQVRSEVGQTALAAASVADFTAIVLLSLFFSSSGGSTGARVPVFLLALLVVRGVPALLGLRQNGPRSTVALGLLQATSLPFIVAATQIGVVSCRHPALPPAEIEDGPADRIRGKR